MSALTRTQQELQHRLLHGARKEIMQLLEAREREECGHSGQLGAGRISTLERALAEARRTTDTAEASSVLVIKGLVEQ